MPTTLKQDMFTMESLSNFEDLVRQGDYYQILNSSLAKVVLGHEKHPEIPTLSLEQPENIWIACFSRLLDTSTNLGNIEAIRQSFIRIGVAALNAFLQSNVTGPPLQWPVSTTLLLQSIRGDSERLEAWRKVLLASLMVDGEAIYSLTPHVELFVLAKRILNSEDLIQDHGPYRWDRLRVNFWHQRMLNDVSASLQRGIYDDLEAVAQSILHEGTEVRARYFLERAAIHMYYGFDAQAREDLVTAANETQFKFVLTGRLGKRTKFQQDELSQLVVLAQSAPPGSDEGPPRSEFLDREEAPKGINNPQAMKPMNLNLDDDTLLEAMSFSKEVPSSIQDNVDIPEVLSSIDVANQPMLEPLDSIILLATASSITSGSPQDELTREVTLPYATRVLQGEGINWQIYTQALLVRSRIEGYRSRTLERGVLQLQAVVDQVIADTASPEGVSHGSDPAKDESVPSTFLPKSKASESAPASERLSYIHQLAPPTRWKLEAELADRWVSLGGVRTALEIYERLQMWAEVALCLAASDREDEAWTVIQRQLYDDPGGDEMAPQERASLPLDAPRLFCILGDLEKSTVAYERAWEVSSKRYARAQRSLGKHYLANNDLPRAEEAYVQSLKINPQNHSTWFALGSIRLRRENWEGAVEAFGRAIQIEETDAESWSNLAAALLQLASVSSTSRTPDHILEPSTNNDNHPPEGLVCAKATTDGESHVREALVAMKRAAVLKRDSYRIWQNLLVVAAKVSPPPIMDIIIAQSRLIELRGPIEGEKCIEVEIVEGLLAHLITTTTSPSSSSHSSSPSTSTSTSSSSPPPPPSSTPTFKKADFPSLLNDLIQTKITPLITTSRRLWLLIAKHHVFRHRYSAALSTYEKAWRATLNRPPGSGNSGSGSGSGSSSASSWDSGTQDAQQGWDEVVEATLDLVDAYESLGERRRESGMGEGEYVCKEWRFKARSALRGVLGRAREVWGGDGGGGEGGGGGGGESGEEKARKRKTGWERLEMRMEELKRTQR